ncbi:hypothetical protein IAT38_003399 [Cryptococcus sp. DSM 104549]
MSLPTRSTLSNDLDLLRTLPTTSIPSLSRPSAPPSKPTSTPSQVLAAFSPGTASPEDSQALAKAYVEEMRGVKELHGSGEGEEVGERIDRLRERGEEIQSALGEIKV